MKISLYNISLFEIKLSYLYISNCKCIIQSSQNFYVMNARTFLKQALFILFCVIFHFTAYSQFSFHHCPDEITNGDNTIDVSATYLSFVSKYSFTVNSQKAGIARLYRKDGSYVKIDSILVTAGTISYLDDNISNIPYLKEYQIRFLEAGASPNAEETIGTISCWPHGTNHVAHSGTIENGTNNPVSFKIPSGLSGVIPLNTTNPSDIKISIRKSGSLSTYPVTVTTLNCSSGDCLCQVDISNYVSTYNAIFGSSIYEFHVSANTSNAVAFGNSVCMFSIIPSSNTVPIYATVSRRVGFGNTNPRGNFENNDADVFFTSGQNIYNGTYIPTDNAYRIDVPANAFPGTLEATSDCYRYRSNNSVYGPKTITSIPSASTTYQFELQYESYTNSCMLTGQSLQFNSSLIGTIYTASVQLLNTTTEYIYVGNTELNGSNNFSIDQTFINTITTTPLVLAPNQILNIPITFNCQTLSSGLTSLSVRDPEGMIVGQASLIEVNTCIAPPDLLATNISTSSNPIKLNDPLSISATIENHGGHFNGTVLLTLETPSGIVFLDQITTGIACKGELTLQDNNIATNSLPISDGNYCILKIKYQEQGSSSFTELYKTGINVIAPIANVDVLWKFPFISQLTSRNWTVACSGAALSSIINGLHNSVISKNNGTYNYTPINYPYQTNPTRLITKGLLTNTYTNPDPTLDNYQKSYPKNGQIQAIGTGPNFKYGPLKNEYNTMTPTPSPTNGNNYTGGSWGSIQSILDSYGIYYKSVNNTVNDYQELLNHLDRGPVIMSFCGHIILVVGKTSGGEFICNDSWGEGIISCSSPSNNFCNPTTTNPPKQDGAYVIYNKNHIINKCGKGAILIPIDENINSNTFSPFHLRGFSSIKFNFDHNQDDNTGYDGDGDYNFYNSFIINGTPNGFKFHARANNTQSKSYLYMFGNQGTTSHSAKWKVRTRKSGTYDFDVKFASNNTNSSEVSYNIYINGTLFRTTQIDQSSNSLHDQQKELRIFSNINLQLGDWVELEVINNVSSPINHGKKIVIDNFVGYYNPNPFVSGPNNHIIISPLASIVPNAKIEYFTTRWKELGITDAQSITETTIYSDSIPGQSFRISAQGYKPLIFDLKSNTIGSNYFQIPMIKEDMSSSQYIISPSVKVENGSLVNITDSITFKFNGENIVDYKLKDTNGVYNPINLLGNKYSTVLSEGINSFTFQLCGLIDTIIINKNTWHYSSKTSIDVLYSNNHPIDNYIEVTCSLDQTSEGSSLYVDGILVKQKISNGTTVRIPAEYTQLTVFKIGYQNKYYHLERKDTNLNISLNERAPYNHSETRTFNNEAHYFGFGVSAAYYNNNTSTDLTAYRYWDALNTIPSHRPISETIKIDNTLQNDTTDIFVSIALDAVYNYSDTSNVYLLVRKGTSQSIIPYNHFGDSIQLDTEYKILKIRDFTDESEVTLVEKETTSFPQINSSKNNLDLHISPIPAKDKIRAKIEANLLEPDYSFYCKTSNGILVNLKTKPLSNNEFEFTVNHLPSGLYFLTVVSKKEVITKSFIIQ